MDQRESEFSLESPLIPGPKKCGVRLTKKCYGKAELISELKRQMRLAGPLVVVSFLQYSLQMISIMFVGHLGELSLLSASMATSFVGVAGFSFMMGIGSALETLCGHAYGAGEYRMLGMQMHRAMLVLTLMSIPVSVLWDNTRQIFLFFKQDPQISSHAEIYALCLIPSIVPYGLLRCQHRFLQSQDVVLPLITSTGVSSLIHVLVCWTLIFKFGFGSQGATLSIAISYWTNVFIFAIYIKFSSICKETWTGFSKEGMENLLAFLKLGIPSALMV